MRIGIFTDSYVPHPDGIAIAVDTMREGLSQAGHEVFIFCPTRPGVVYDDPHVVAYRSVPALIYEGLRLAQPFGKDKLKKIEELKLDAIHIQLPFALGFAGMWAAKKLDIPLVMSCHQDMDYVRDYRGAFLASLLVILPAAFVSGRLGDGFGVIFGRRRNKSLPWRYDLVRRAYGFLTDQCDIAIAPSHKVFDQLDPYSSKHNFLIVPNCINPSILPKKLSREKARQRLDIGHDYPILVTTSRLVKEKRLDLVIRGFAALDKKHKLSQLYIVGDGPMRTELEALASRLGLGDRIKFCGAQPHKEVFIYLAAADIYINACPREIMSLSALEAGAMAKPLLIFDNRLVELIKDGQSGFFVKDPKDLALKAKQLLKNEQLRTKMGKAARARTMKNYSLAAHAKALTDVYRLAASGQVPAEPGYAGYKHAPAEYEAPPSGSGVTK